ncbi:MAG: MerR family transcriptional regulator [Drouetiella hepatica Uher 2000/2452]|jgi:DNA-binding transcriptional MerR regulator|uniref:MerR family transcriptional regulator n=1 Tax=Drouetiella hepatica Uher 2000/2452 TaxID=904376 RepID=A0A951ULQ1_9CYAN|nr:MerR family transcriptional regulator [Drouetiella hepatica Uher 2000/2452]
MLRIGDFSRLAQVSVRTLRYYEELSLLKPIEVDRFTDYRYYSVDQLPRLNRVLALKDLGFSLNQIKDLLDSDLTLLELRAMLTVRQAEIEQQLQEGMTKLTRVEARLRQIEREGKLADYEVVLKRVEPKVVAATRQIVPTVTAILPYRGKMYAEVYTWLNQHRIKAGEPEMAIYHNAEYTEKDIDMEMAVAIDPAAVPSALYPLKEQVYFYELPLVQTMASLTRYGKLSDIGQGLIELFTWMGENGYSADGAYREIHLFGREFEQVQDQWECNPQLDFDAVVVELQIPVKRLS